MRTSDEHVLARESYWKDVLLSQKFCYNKTDVNDRAAARANNRSRTHDG